MSQKKFLQAIEKQRLHALQAGIQAMKTDELQLVGVPINQRLQIILDMNTRARKSKPGEVYFVVMYDIENNKVRTRIAKYLIRKGCERMQKSVYIALLHRSTLIEMQETLVKIQSMYKNQDSIIFMPISSDMVDKMKLIGHNINVQMTLQHKTCLVL